MTHPNSKVPVGSARCVVPVPDEPGRYPERFGYDPGQRILFVGAGRFAPVAPEVWGFSVSGLEVVKSWLGYRMKRRAGRASSELDAIRPERWTDEFTTELLELLWVLEGTVAMYPRLEELLDEILSGPCFSADELPMPSQAQRRPPVFSDQPPLFK